MSVKLDRAGPSRLAGTGAYSLGEMVPWSLTFYLDASSGNTTTENQTIYSSGGAAAGSFNLSYCGPNNANPNTLGFAIGSASTFYKLPNGSIPPNWKGFVNVQRIGGGISIHWCPVLTTAPTDGSSVQSGTNLVANSTTVNAMTNKVVSLGARANNDRGLDQTIARLGLISGSLTTLELARLAYGETLYDLGYSPLIYVRMDNASDLANTGSDPATLAQTGTFATGAAPGFGYVPTTPVAPSFTAAPAINGSPVVGTASAYTPGQVSGSPAPTVTRQWLVDGAAVAGATGTTYTPVQADQGKSLSIRETATNASGTASSTSSAVAIGGAPVFVDGLTAMPASRPYQRMGTSAAVPMSGTYNTAPTTVEAQLVSLTDGTTVLQAWTPLTNLVVADNAWSGTLAANPGGGYRAQVRFKNASGVVTFTSPLDANGWGVGEILAGAGSSTIHGWWNSGTYPGNGYLRRYLTTSGKYLWEPFPSASNGVAKKISADLAARLSGAAVGMIGAGESGTTLAQWLVTGGTQFGRLRSAINAQGGKIGGLIISMGSNDVAENLVASRASHASRLRQFIQSVRDLTGNPDLKVLISGYNSRLNVSAVQSDYVRMAERDVGSDANVYHFPTFDMTLGSDGTHLESYDLSGDRANYVFNPIIAGDPTYRRGPCITAITYSGNKFFVAIQHRNGTDIPAGAYSGFAATDDSGTLNVTAARVSANRIEVTCNRALAANPKLTYMAGNAPDTSSPVYDNGTMALPMDVETDMAATQQPTGPDVTAPVFTGALQVTNIINNGATITAPAATDDTGVAGYQISTNGGTSYNNAPGRVVPLSGLPAGTTYQVRMRAYDAALNYSAPLSTSFTTLSDTPPETGIDATKVPAERRVVFEGSKRVVSFDGSIRKVIF